MFQCQYLAFVGYCLTYSLAPPGRSLVAPIALAPLQQEITIILTLSLLQRYTLRFYIIAV